jgi:hypothetical protein
VNLDGRLIVQANQAKTGSKNIYRVNQISTGGESVWNNEDKSLAQYEMESMG